MRGTRRQRESALTDAERVTLPTTDGLRLSASHLPAASSPRDIGFVLAHGFSGHHRKPAQVAIARRLSSYGGVLALDLRGHGESGGLSTLGDLEVLDIDAAVQWLRSSGYPHVVTCGWSMGGSVVMRHAALFGGVDAVVSVSATSRWFVRDTAPMRRLHWLVERPLGRAVSRSVLRIRLVPRWTVVPESPLEVVGRIAPTPLLVVHGDRDPYFGLEHPRALARAAGATGELWIVPGFGHAEGAAALMPEVVDGIGERVLATLARGRPAG